MSRYRINFDGLLKSPASWAKVNRELLKALIRHEQTEVAIQPRRGFNWEESFPLAEELQNKPTTYEDPEARLTFTFPPLLDREQDEAGHHLLLSLYEATRLPESWLEPLRNHAGTILVPSETVKRIYVSEGIPRESLSKIPYGYDPEVFHPPKTSSSDDESLRVLSVATPHYRKGLDYLRSLEDVAARGDVTWHCHVPYRPGESSDFWEDPRIVNFFENGPFKLTTESVRDDEIASWMQQSDLVVQPSRSEGFGLVILESMACGTPVVTSDWGGHQEFAGPGMIKVSGSHRPAGRAQYHQRRSGAEVVELDGSSFRTVVRSLLDRPERLERLGDCAVRTVENLTWDESAEKVVDRLESL
jgi:glycosyltransferase involved in cell wall biosynthesis